MHRSVLAASVLVASCGTPPARPERTRVRVERVTTRPERPARTGPLTCPSGWRADAEAQAACVRDEPAARCSHLTATIAATAPMSLADSAGLQVRGLAGEFDLSASAAIDRNGRSGLEVRGARGGQWVRVQAFEAGEGLVLVRCEGDGGVEDAGAADVDEVLASADLGEDRLAEADPDAPTWLAELETEPPLGEVRPLGAGFTAAMPADWQIGEEAADPSAVATPPQAVDAEGGAYRIACMPFHEAPTVAELLDRHSPVVGDEALQTGTARLGDRMGTVMRSAAKVPSRQAGRAPRGRRGRRVVALGMAYAGIFRFIWAEGARRCVLRYESPAGARNVPDAIDRLTARLPEVVKVVASLRAR